MTTERENNLTKFLSFSNYTLENFKPNTVASYFSLITY